MLKDLISKMKNVVKNLQVWILYQNYAQTASKSIQREITESLDEAFEENVQVMNAFKERLVKIYNDDKRN